MLRRYAELLREWVEEARGLKQELGEDEAVKERLVAGWAPLFAGYYDRETAANEIRMDAAGVLRYLSRSG